MPGDRRTSYSSQRITTTATTAVGSGSRRLIRVIVEAALTGTATFNDAIGTKLLLPIGFPAGSHWIDIAFAGKLEIVTSANDRLVIVFE